MLRRLGLIRWRSLPVPTWRGLLLLIVVAGGLVAFVGQHLHDYLAPRSPVGGDLLVVEGWLPDYALREASQIAAREGYRWVATTGGPVVLGGHLSEFRDYADLAAASLVRMGLARERILPVPAPRVRADRTWTSAVALRRRLAELGLSVDRLDVFSLGAHARRTRLLFDRAFGGSVRVGVIAGTERGFVPRRWWRSSAGVRTVISESVAWLYARLLFRPPSDAEQRELEGAETEPGLSY